MNRRADWTDANESDPGIAVLELFEYLGELLSYYQDRIEEEKRLRTRRRVAVVLGVAAVLFWRCGRKRQR